MIMIRTVPNIMKAFSCSADSAQRYIDLRDEGYGQAQAALMAGLADPPDPDHDTLITDPHAGVLGHASEDPELLRQCAASGQMSAAQVVAHASIVGVSADAPTELESLLTNLARGLSTCPCRPLFSVHTAEEIDSWWMKHLAQQDTWLRETAQRAIHLLNTAGVQEFDSCLGKHSKMQDAAKLPTAGVIPSGGQSND